MLCARPIPVDVISAKRIMVLLLDIGRSRKLACEPPFMLMFTNCDFIPLALLDNFIGITLGALMLLVLTAKKKIPLPSTCKENLP